MKKTLLLIVVLLITKFSISQNEKFSKVKIYIDNKGIENLQKLGLPVDDGIIKKNVYIISELSENDILKIKTNNFKYDVLIDDVSDFYVTRYKESIKNIKSEKTKNIGKYTTPVNFELGSMGGFYTYQEMLRELDSMKLKFPTIFKTKQAVSDTNTFENRPIY